MLSSSNARLVAARRLTRRAARRAAGRFLAEGPQAVRAALDSDAVLEVFATAEAIERYPELTADAAEISAKDAAALSETVRPQGVVAVCHVRSTALREVADAQLLAVLVEPSDPGNLGTIIRTADASGAGAVVLVGGVDPYNGKAVRASAGSIFHIPLVPTELAEVLALAGTSTLATTASGNRSLDELIDTGALEQRTAWLFGSEAHGLPKAVLDAASDTVRVPIHGRAESLNLAATAAVCLYASAHAQRRSSDIPPG